MPVTVYRFVKGEELSLSFSINIFADNQLLLFDQQKASGCGLTFVSQDNPLLLHECHEPTGEPQSNLLSGKTLHDSPCVSTSLSSTSNNQFENMKKAQQQETEAAAEEEKRVELGLLRIVKQKVVGTVYAVSVKRQNAPSNFVTTHAIAMRPTMI